jgi:hypothetical protein
VFTTGSKYLFGLSALGLVAFVINAIQSTWSPLASLTLLSFVLATGFLGFVAVAFRDAEAPALAQLATSAADAEGRAVVGHRVPNSPWSILAGFGVAALAVGVVVDQLLFILGVVILVAVLIEWMVQGWADRASADPAYNAELRARTMHPFEYPIAGALLAGVVIISFSRVMLSLTISVATIAFSVVSAVIFIGALILAAQPAVRRTLMTGLLALLGVGLLGSGIAAAAIGPHKVHPIEEAGSTEGVSNPTGLVATISLAGGVLEVQPNGKPVASEPRLEVPRALVVNLLFRNEDSEPAEFVVVTRAVVDGELTEVEVRTGLLEEGGAQSLAVEFPSTGEYEFFVEGGAAEVSGTIEAS